MKKIESSLKNMLLSLVTITVVASSILAIVYNMTEEQIEIQKKESINKARLSVLGNCKDGRAIEVEENGFGGKFRLMVGYDRDGTILGYEILEHQETPGLGSHMSKWFKNADKAEQNIIGRKYDENLRVRKDGGDVDAITAATISSRAFLKAVNEAGKQFKSERDEQK